MANLNRNHKQDEEYVMRSFPLTTDTEMANHLRIGIGLVRKIRNKLGLRRERWCEVKKETIGLILEMFANGRTIVYISRITLIQVHKVDRIIDAHWMNKTRSYNTITLVMDSKINYD